MGEVNEEVGLDNLTGRQKAAILMVALGPETSSRILTELKEDEIEELTKEIALMHDVPPKVRYGVVEEFHQMMLAHSYILKGGVDYARQVLESAVGDRKAADVMHRIQRFSLASDFSSMRGVDPAQFLSLLQKEHPQTMALILSQLDANQAAAILKDLPKELQPQVIRRMATMEQVSPDTLHMVKGILESRVERTARVKRIGGVKAAADVLNLVGQSLEKEILEELSQEDPQLSSEIKHLMFTFEDIGFLDDRAIQRILREVETKELSIALKGASDAVKERIFSNMSERAVSLVKEELEYMGPVRLKDVEAAQQVMIDAVRSLEEAGEIVVTTRGKKEDFVV